MEPLIANSIGLPTELAPRDQGTSRQESVTDYIARWPSQHSNVPTTVVETWFHRHWAFVQAWAPLKPLSWTYARTEFTAAALMAIGHVGDWLNTLDAWGDELLDGSERRCTWLGAFMLENRRWPAPIIVLEGVGQMMHPREGQLMDPYLQLVEGHLRLAYLRALIRRHMLERASRHDVVLATLPPP